MNTLTQPKVSIIVVNYNTVDLLPQALLSIKKTVQLPYEVLVIDNASTDGGLREVPEDLRNDPRFRFLEYTRNEGLAAMNRVLTDTTGEYILTLDPDARLLPGALEKMVNFLDATEEAGAVSANLLNPNGSEQRYIRRLITPKLGFYTTVMGRVIDKYFLQLRNYHWYHYADAVLEGSVEIEQPSVSCLLIRRRAANDCIVDPDTPFYFTDVGLCKRIYNKGYKIYLVSEAKVTHLKSTAFNKTKNMWRENEYRRSLVTYYRKEYPGYALIMSLLLLIDQYVRVVVFKIMGREPIR